MSQQDKKDSEKSKKDLLSLPFGFVNQKSKIMEEFSSSLQNVSSLQSIENRLSLNLGHMGLEEKGQIRQNVFNDSASSQQDLVSEEKKAMEQKLVKDIPNAPQFESTLHEPQKRMRKSSFFQNQDFSSSFYISEPQKSHENLPQTNLDLIEENTESQETPRFRNQFLDDSGFEIFDYLNKCSKISSSPKIFNMSSQTEISSSSKSPVFSEITLQYSQVHQEHQNHSDEPEYQATKKKSKQNNIETPFGLKRKEYFELQYPPVSLKYSNSVYCYNCGENHYANQCISIQPNHNSNNVNCFNCKQKGHAAKYCPQARRCNACQSLDHISRECPSHQTTRRNKVCLNCKQPGHFAKQCTKQIKCYYCHQIGHQLRNCPKNKQKKSERDLNRMSKPRICFNCKREGHYASNCPEPSRCHLCGQEGHFSRDCPHFGNRSKSSSEMINKYEYQEQEKKSESLEKPASQPQIRKNKPFLKQNFKKKKKGNK